jgi:hypothetical protein
MHDPGTTALDRIAEALAGIGLLDDLGAPVTVRPGTRWSVESRTPGRAPAVLFASNDRAEALHALAAVRAAGAVAKLSTVKDRHHADPHR